MDIHSFNNHYSLHVSIGPDKGLAFILLFHLHGYTFTDNSVVFKRIWAFLNYCKYLSVVIIPTLMLVDVIFVRGNFISVY